METKGLNGKNLYQWKNDYGKGGILYGLFLAPKIKYCIVIDENGILSPKTTFKRYDQNMVRLIFKEFLDLERGDIILGKSKPNWKSDLLGVKIPLEYFDVRNVMMIKYANNVRNLLKWIALNVRWLKLVSIAWKNNSN